ncbi:hypothetical protein MMC13_008394 [Lambiella insularis]|nr:hypothetical protein [Lambiella insularis]
MPRQRGRPAASSSRPAVVPTRSNVTPKQSSRSSSTIAHPPTAPAPNPQTSQAPGLFGQMASTAAGVAVGSSVGHALGGLFRGSGHAAEPQTSDAMTTSEAQNGTYQSTNWKNCEPDAKSFTKCLDANKGSQYQMSICGWYLEQLASLSQWQDTDFMADYGTTL